MFACGIRNPGLWNPLVIELVGTGMPLAIGVQNQSDTDKKSESITRNPESTAWNPEFTTVLDSLIWAKQRKGTF